MNSPYNGKFRVSQIYKGALHDGLDLVGVDSKEIHSTVDGVVEVAGWENASNHSQGFGLYVRIKKAGSNDRYYFGHMSAIGVKAGFQVKVGDVIGIEGSTGKSTGSHCHYCVRTDCSKLKIKNVSEISGIPNVLGTYDDGYLAKITEKKKTVTDIAQEVIAGIWGNGAERKGKLINAGYDYNAVQEEVNRILSKSTVSAPLKKSNEEIAKEVLAGKWGNGSDRKKKLKAAGYDYSAIQKIVNKLLKK